MNRRTLLKALLLAGGAAVASIPFVRRDTFYVAGARYFDPHHDLRRGDVVVLLADTFRGERCYRIEDGRGVQIGYVPRALVDSVARRGLRSATLLDVSLHRVPWRWYRVAL